MKITARCHPLLEPILPKPFLAKSDLPNWLTQMPGKVEAETLGGAEIRTLKHCPPFIDALSSGILIPLPTDITIMNGELAWDWDPPILEDASITRSPIGVHVPEQAMGAPIDVGGRLILKFTNFWTFETGEDWQLLFTHPLNQNDLPFQTMSGLVDCHGFKNGYVHFPALLDHSFEGVIKMGTPIAQIIPVPKARIDFDIANMSEKQIQANLETQEMLQSSPGIYRKNFKHKT